MAFLIYSAILFAWLAFVTFCIKVIICNFKKIKSFKDLPEKKFSVDKSNKNRKGNNHASFKS